MAEISSKEGKNELRQWLIGTPDEPGLLKKMGMSIEVFARRAGLRRSTLYFFLDDTNRPSPDSLAKFCEILGVSYAEGLKHVDPRLPGRPKKKVAGPATTPRRRRLNVPV